MAHWQVSGTYLARRADWQSFTKVCEATSAEQAQEWALSEIGGCHGVKRSLIRITATSEVPA
jgi:ribosomal protein L20A (L18A)